MATLERDNDFDLMISDAQRGSPADAREGARFALEVRDHRDPVINSLPIIFYTAWPTVETAERFVKPAMTTSPRPRVSISVDTLLPEAIDVLAAARQNPIPVAAKAKTPT